MVAAQAEVGKKTNEVPMATVVLGQIDLNNKIVTADALHTVKATASHIHEHGGEFVFPVKENRRACSTPSTRCHGAGADSLHPTDKSHGWITTRTIQVLLAPEDLPFPHVSQVFLIGHITDLRGQPSRPSPPSASPARHPIRRAPRTWHVREQWSIESLHWLRDAFYQEDKSKVRTRNGPRVMAALRNSSGHSEWPDAPTSPKPPDGPDAPGDVAGGHFKGFHRCLAFYHGSHDVTVLCHLLIADDYEVAVGDSRADHGISHDP